jgi:type 1 glutamine amidotransferase
MYFCRHADFQGSVVGYHDFDGGRAFYTGLGHTDESFADPLFLQHIWGGIVYAMNG